MAGCAGLLLGLGAVSVAAGVGTPAERELGEAVVVDPETIGASTSRAPGAPAEQPTANAPTAGSPTAAAPTSTPTNDVPEPATAPQQVVPAPPSAVVDCEDDLVDDCDDDLVDPDDLDD